MGINTLLRHLRTRSIGKTSPVHILEQDVEKPSAASSSSSWTEIPSQQQALLLYRPKQPYQEISNHPIPAIRDDRELLVRNMVIGLNPIDWKAPWVSPFLETCCVVQIECTNNVSS
jgi:hypothetical protein